MNPEDTITENSHPTAEEGQLTVDVYQTGGEIVIQSTVAGATSENIDISLAKDTVTIQGHRHNPERVDPASYAHRELHWGPFSRSIILPAEIDVDRAKAVIKNGLLTIKLPKIKSI